MHGVTNKSIEGDLMSIGETKPVLFSTALHKTFFGGFTSEITW